MAHRARREARERALASVRAGGGLVLVLGPPGTGKSSLLRELARALGEAGYDVLLRPRGDIPVEAEGAAPGGAVAGPAPRVILIDEAHCLDRAALERLGRLGARHVVLAGLSGSGGDLDRLPVRAAVVQLAPLPPDEVGAFAAAHLARDGRRAPPPSEHAVRRLAECSGGVPRALDALTGAAASLAVAEGAARIEASHVDRAAATRDGDAAPAGSSWAGDDGDPRRHAGADVRAGTPAIGASPDRGQAARPRAALGVAALGVTLCAVAGVAASFGWRSLQPDDGARRERLASAHPAAAFVGPPGPGRTAGAADPPGSAPAAPTAVTPTAVMPVQASDPGRAVSAPVPPGPAPTASDPVASTASGQVAPAASEPVVSATSGQAAPAAFPVSERREDARGTPASPEPAVPAARSLPVAPPPAAWALPAGAPVRVVIYRPRDDARAAARAAGLARALRAAGMAAGEPVAIPQRSGKPGVRYFFAEDRDAAVAVLERAGLASEDVLAGGARPGVPSHPGMIEVTLPPG